MSTLPSTPTVAADSEMPARWYQLATRDHFWMSWRLAVCRRLIADAGLPTTRPLRGLEIGCGEGLVQRQLSAATAWTIDGCDLNRAALAANDSAPGRSFFYDIHERRQEFDRAYDFLLLFDVLEHIAEPVGFLEAALYHLRPGGFVVLNVPALRLFYSRYDRAVGHLRRYDRRTLKADLAGAGLEPGEMRYWGMTMLPLLCARPLVTAFQRRPERIVASGFEPPARGFSAAMRLLMRIETRLLKRPFLGSSLVALAQRPA